MKDYTNMFSFSIGSCAMIIYAIIAIISSILQLIPSYAIAKWTAMPFEEQ